MCYLSGYVTINYGDIGKLADLFPIKSDLCAQKVAQEI
jgi:hypothetical protein